jgi:hypothetical protein
MSISPSQYQFVQDKEYSDKAKKVTGVNNRWYSIDRYLKLKSKEYNLSLKDTIDVEKEKLKQKTFSEKIKHQVQQLENFYLKENDFLGRFKRIGNSSYLNQNYDWITQLNSILAYGIFILSWCLFLTPFKNNIMMSFYYKAMFFFITSQSAFYFSHGRYYISLIILTMCFLTFTLYKEDNLKNESFNIYKINTIKLGYCICWIYALYHLFLLASFYFYI